ELVNSFGSVENILARVNEITKKRPREALIEQADLARLSKELVTIRDDLPMSLDLEGMRLTPPDLRRLRTLYVELEFHTLARALADVVPEVDPEEAAPQAAAKPVPTRYTIVDTVTALEAAVARARAAAHIAVAIETVVDPSAPSELDPLRSTIVG